MIASASDAMSLLNLKIARLEYEKQSVQFSRRERIFKRKEVEYLKTIRDKLNSEGGTIIEEQIEPFTEAYGGGHDSVLPQRKEIQRHGRAGA